MEVAVLESKSDNKLTLRAGGQNLKSKQIFVPKNDSRFFSYYKKLPLS